MVVIMILHFRDVLRLSEVLRDYRPRSCQEAASSLIHHVLLLVPSSRIVRQKRPFFCVCQKWSSQ